MVFWYLKLNQCFFSPVEWNAAENSRGSSANCSSRSVSIVITSFSGRRWPALHQRWLTDPSCSGTWFWHPHPPNWRRWTWSYGKKGCKHWIWGTRLTLPYYHTWTERQTHAEIQYKHNSREKYFCPDLLTCLYQPLLYFFREEILFASTAPADFIV